MKIKQKLERRGKLSLRINVRKDLLESQILDIDKRSVVAAAHGQKIHYTLIVNELARRCLAIGVFELSFDGIYRGIVSKFIEALRHTGIVI